MRLLVVAAAIAAIAAVAAGPGSAWSDSAFYNPGGNVQCVFVTRPLALTCEVNSNGHVVALYPNGARTDSGYRRGYLGAKVGHMLRYGQRWQSHQFTCLSTYQGMRCWTGSGLHGFFASAWSVKAW